MIFFAALQFLCSKQKSVDSLALLADFLQRVMFLLLRFFPQIQLFGLLVAIPSSFSFALYIYCEDPENFRHCMSVKSTFFSSKEFLGVLIRYVVCAVCCERAQNDAIVVVECAESIEELKEIGNE